MKDRLAEKGARAVEAWLEENGLGIVPRLATEMMEVAGDKAADDNMWPDGIYETMIGSAPTPDTKGLAQAVLDAISGAYDDPDGKEPTGRPAGSPKTKSGSWGNSCWSSPYFSCFSSFTGPRLPGWNGCGDG